MFFSGVKADSDGQAQKGRTYPAHSLLKKRQVSGDPGQQRLQMQQVLNPLRKGIEKVQGCGKDGACSDADIDLLVIGKELSGQT